MDLAKQGAEALSNNDAQSAVTQYTKALLVHPTSPDYLIQRSTAFTRLKPPRHDLALKDAELAVLCGRKRASRKHIQLAQLRRVVSLYHNAKYAEAKYLLQTMEKWFSKEGDKDKQVQEAMSRSGEKKGVMEAKIWLIKIEKKLKEMPQDEVTEGEYPEAEVDEKKLLNLYKSQLTAEGVFKLDWQQGQENAPLQTPKETTTTPAATSAPSAAPAQTKVRHEWYQNNQSVIITIYAKGVPKDQADIDIQEDSVSAHPAMSTEALQNFWRSPRPNGMTCLSMPLDNAIQPALSSAHWS
jgi:suppressor of G2 allele of SKP1